MDLYNIFDNVEFDSQSEKEEIIYEDDKIKIIRIVSLDQSTDYMIQDMLEIVKIVRGYATVEIEGELVALRQGDILPIEANQKHRVVTQDHVIWLCIFVK